MCFQRSFRCDYATEYVEEYNGKGWEKSNWDLIICNLSQLTPAEDSGVCDWNSLLKLDASLWCFHTRELLR